MNKNLLWVQISLLLLAGILFFINTKLNSPLLVSAAILCFCLFLFVAGGDAMVSKKLGFFPKNLNFGRTETYHGRTAQLWGITFIFMGICLLVVAVLNLTLTGGMEEFWSILLGTNWGWGTMLVCIGLVVLMMGIIRSIAGSGGYYTGLQDKVERISGIIPTIFGVGLVLIGIITLFFPNLLHSLFDQVINLFNK